ncbi:group I truncated hemoglobin [Sphingomonas sp. Leaf226]|uniref:group I truncated hemoglobin n=1 Tax=Sphingomonas sp. Leaf226 TaxID=1735691 RepID=UPI000700E1B4|nr:group 1 truncated hemoglobin [Sphingomonas sp. Leaf226]KQM98460.1 hypothetical protein ASE77_18025 [Sphingomonas sp. Leaf226]
MILLALLVLLQTAPTPPGEDPVAPYAMSDANVGGGPFKGVAMLEAFHGVAGIDRIVDDLVKTSQGDPRIGDIFKGQDMVRLRRTLKEQFCVLLNGGCSYTGRDMATAHKSAVVRSRALPCLRRFTGWLASTGSSTIW